MIVHDVEQGSPEWQRLRAGIPTASQFNRIITPTGRASKQADEYMRHLIAERMMGLPLDSPKTSWMERGMEMESEAVCYYEFERDCAVEPVGFITDDAHTYGASPDRLIGEDGVLEIKCPSPQVHIGYMLYKDVDLEYWCQLQGQLFVSGREWADICSYHPCLDSVILRVLRDEQFISRLAEEIAEFNQRLEAECARLEAEGFRFKLRTKGVHGNNQRSAIGSGNEKAGIGPEDLRQDRQDFPGRATGLPGPNPAHRREDRGEVWETEEQLIERRGSRESRI